VGCAVVLATFSILHSGAAAATSQVEDLGSGGLVLPSDSAQKMRAFAINCTGCSWRFLNPCAVRLQVIHRPCEVRDPSCSQDLLRRVWVLEPDDFWREIGVVCFSRGGPVFLRTIQLQAEQLLVDALPKLSFDCTPKSGIVENLSLACNSSLRKEISPLHTKFHGIPIRIEVKPHWHWSVGEGSGVGQIDQRRSTRAISWHHVFAHRGQFQVSHRVTWVATMHLEGSAGGIRLPDVVHSAHNHIWVGTMAPVLVIAGR
jgi:hypothetical protein